ncbi:Endonuclease V like protein [Aduncisulcus paluster]|uniref:Endonuclease V like protein n=1 Tax=Aduncisulcus paluster TaxID=2918883 RepID=A0ABQ5K302_9EUKA|nr:Endonuclease V like protein [Aduncisulcus paluster]
MVDTSFLSSLEKEQDKLKSRLSTSNLIPKDEIKFIGGIDIGYDVLDPSIGVACLVICKYVPGVEITDKLLSKIPSASEDKSFDFVSHFKLHDCPVVYKDFVRAKLTIEYIPGFLAFREMPLFLPLFERLSLRCGSFFAGNTIYLVDGNGLLHPKRFGSASHIGVVTNQVTIGVAKSLMRLRDDIPNEKDFKKTLPPVSHALIKDSDDGFVFGAALKAVSTSKTPIFISIGHGIDLETSLDIVKSLCIFRQPEPIRAADRWGRYIVRQHQTK